MDSHRDDHSFDESPFDESPFDEPNLEGPFDGSSFDESSFDSSSFGSPAPDEFESLEAGHRCVPLFPLPGLYLLPNTLVPLHVFEPRYREMVKDLLDGSGQLVIGTVPEDAGTGVGLSEPFVQPVAGIGRVENYHALDDGRFYIVVLGLARGQIREIESDRPYRMAAVELLEEVPESPVETELLQQQLRDALGERAGDDLELPDGLSVGRLSDLLLLYLELPAEEMARLYSCLEVAERARGALDLAESD